MIFFSDLAVNSYFMRIIFVLFLSLSLSSCIGPGVTEEDIIVPENKLLNGDWSLNFVSCFCLFEDDYNYAQSQLSFEDEVHKVAVVSDPETIFLAPSGTYEYTYINDIFSLVGFEENYQVSLTDGFLNLTFIDNPQIADDELGLSYIKNTP